MDSNTIQYRPYVICHVISSLDGRISGSAFELDETIDAMEEHWQIRADYGCDAVMNGAITAAEIYADGFLESGELRNATTDRGVGGHRMKTDRVAETDLENFVVCVDPEGTLRWSRNYIERPVQPRSHVIEVLLETVPDSYLEYLDDLNISYLFAGKDRLDIDLLMSKLATAFGIERMLVTGGGKMDWTMLRAGAVDEISVIITPTIGGDRDVATMFDRPAVGFAREESGPGVSLKLLEVRQLEGGSLLLRYMPGAQV